MKAEDIQTLIEMTKEGYTDRAISKTLFYSLGYIRNMRRSLGLVKRMGDGFYDRRMQEEDPGNGEPGNV